MYECYIKGVGYDGKEYPREHRVSTICIQHMVDEYITKYPVVVRVIVDCALPMILTADCTNA